ncbi:alpha/beta hydrolase [Amycolatopsis suaedae]|uniref:Alpha/beta hydrolase n=1 Tax=Amycolatopsis suaedae TaxID=2510978 RepID=A0A4Q7J2G2_9PSEU|nr:alpha/beta hydrolase [Amycolatopsis suaedae]RZQ60938.1 alpha/beta hydrolase [Amycolatopsis suaedae]
MAVLGPLLTAVPAAQASAGIDWKPCADKPEVECARLAVPVDWDKPDGDKIELSLARRKGAEGGDKLGTLMYGPGGPGGAGARDLKSDPIFETPVYQRYDVISYDSRGIGESSPVQCDTANQTRAWPSTEEQFTKQVAQNKAYIEDCRKRTGPVFDHVDTISDVKDMDAIRAALGEEKLNYYGVSYGTLRGQQYAENFPTRVGRLVLDSTMDHSIDNTWDFMRTETHLREELFGIFTQWCEKEATCSLHGRDVPALMKQLYDKAAKGELADPKDPARKLNPVDFALSLEPRVLSERWAELADYIKSFGQGAPASLAAAPAAQRPDPSRAIWCNDWDYRISSFGELRELTDKLAEASPNVRFSSYDTWAVVCLGWEGKPVNPPHKLTLSDEVPPILITNSRYDPATVYPWAQAVSEQSGMPLVTYDGGGHGMYFVDSCSREHIHNYLFKGDVPPANTHCPVQNPVSAGAVLPKPRSLADFTG